MMLELSAYMCTMWLTLLTTNLPLSLSLLYGDLQSQICGFECKVNTKMISMNENENKVKQLNNELDLTKRVIFYTLLMYMYTLVSCIKYNTYMYMYMYQQ